MPELEQSGLVDAYAAALCVAFIPDVAAPCTHPL